jgi:DNA-binding transcriptional MerR regulator
MRIGELAKRTGVSERLLRYYEEQGLLQPERRPSGYREYDETAVAAVRRIRCLIAAGLHTATIAAVLPCLRDEGERMIPTCPDLLTLLRRERGRIEHQVDQLRASMSMLDSVIESAPAFAKAKVFVAHDITDIAEVAEVAPATRPPVSATTTVVAAARRDLPTVLTEPLFGHMTAPQAGVQDL